MPKLNWEWRMWQMPVLLLRRSGPNPGSSKLALLRPTVCLCGSFQVAQVAIACRLSTLPTSYVLLHCRNGIRHNAAEAYHA